jgi:glycosyltransferase involved in cell wall biosynthesis
MVAVSEQLRCWLIDDVGIPARKVRLLKNGVDAKSFVRRPDREALRRAAGYAPSDVVVGTVGRLDPVKNQVALIEVLSMLAPHFPQLRVLIAGDGPARPQLKREITERGLTATAALLGHRDDIPDVLNLLDIFVLPSLGEGMCNTVLEAMATTLPVIATRVGGNPEMVADGTTGCLVPVQDTLALASALRTYLNDPQCRCQHGAAGRRLVEDEFSVVSMVERYVQLYTDEMEGKRCAA